MFESFTERVYPEEINTWNKSFITVKIAKKAWTNFVYERYRYSAYDLSSDVGGFCGLFLGLSIWEIFNAGIQMAEWVKKKVIMGAAGRK